MGEPVLPAGSAVAVIERAGQFVQLERPDDVARQVLDFIG